MATATLNNHEQEPIFFRAYGATPEQGEILPNQAQPFDLVGPLPFIVLFSTPQQDFTAPQETEQAEAGSKSYVRLYNQERKRDSQEGQTIYFTSDAFPPLGLIAPGGNQFFQSQEQAINIRLYDTPPAHQEDSAT